MTAAKIITPGTRFGRLVLIEHLESEQGRRVALFECDCGIRKKIQLQPVYRELVKSCGCIRRETNSVVHKTHGYAGTKRATEYRIWSLMIQRCENEKNPAYSRYGGRGIRVCDRWHRFENFLEDMGRRPRDRSLDRRDNNGHYEPGNCRWATASEQMKNRRPFHKSV